MVISLPTHQEMIKSKFISKFKNPLRNYYSYGFMSYSQIEESKHTIDDDWRRLSNILKSDSYFTWSDNKNNSIFLTSDSASQNCNPFHRVYRFRLFDDGDIIRFYNIVLALSDKYKLAVSPYEIEGSKERTMRLINQTEHDEKSAYSGLRYCKDKETGKLTKTEISFELSEIDQYLQNIESNQLETKQLAEFCMPENEFLTENQNVRNTVKELEKLGIVSRVNTKKNAPWKLNSLTMKKVIDCCRNEKDKFIRVLNFYSQYLPLGEFGSYMLSRLDNNVKNIFRFKHEYFIHALNDYVRIDLIYAIEQKQWCRIRYYNNMLKSEGTLICFPLQIMTSQKGGREYLSLYEPFKRMYTNLRLDFIETIEYVNKIESGSEAVSLENPQIAKDIEYAKKNLSHSWGVSTTIETEGNSACPAQLFEVTLKAKYNPEKEPYILKRFQNERRIAEEPTVEHDTVTFRIKVTDTKEMRPWIRSFYTRIIDYSGLDREDFNIRDDVKYMLDPSSRLNSDIQKTTDRINFEIPENTTWNTLKTDTNNALFNRCFCTYFMIFGDILSGIYDNAGDTIQLSELKSIISESVKKRENELGELTVEILNLEQYNPLKMLERCGFIEKIDKNNYCLKYNKTFSDKESLFYDTVPLTYWEIRWLKTVLNDKKISIFLSDETVNSILSILPDDIKPIDTDKTICFDRYHPEENTLNKELYNLYLSALNNNTVIHIKHTDGAYTNSDKDYIPEYIEYSKRDDKFRLIVKDAVTGIQSRVLCENILEISLTDKHYQSDSVCHEMEKYSVTLSFKDVKNIPDRILSEFSPWEKTCEFNSETEVYKLTIYYYKHDEPGLIVRIMSYGGNIEITDKNHSIYLNIRKRLLEQQKLLADKN